MYLDKSIEWLSSLFVGPKMVSNQQATRKIRIGSWLPIGLSLCFSYTHSLFLPFHLSMLMKL